MVGRPRAGVYNARSVRTLAGSVSAALALAFALALASCARWLPAPIPMRSIAWPGAGAGAGPGAGPRQPANRARCLAVFLPGLGDDADDFARNGLVAAVQRRGLSVDLIAASATIGYYARGTFVSRLAAAAVGPGGARGPAPISLRRTSPGGG